jgi:hypothetical protein
MSVDVGVGVGVCSKSDCDNASFLASLTNS